MKNIFEKLKNYKNNINANFAIAFAVVVIALAGVSFYKFVDFLKNDRADYNEWNADFGDKLEAKLSTNFFQKFNFINLNGLVRKVLGQREMNGVVKLNNGHLLTTISYTEDEKLEAYAEKILQAKNYLAESGIEFIYAITPYTSCKFDPQLPVGIEDYGNDDLDRLCGFLREKGIEPVDFRQEFYDDGIDHYKMMYRTDHHWTTEAGFYAFNKLNAIIEQKLNVQVDERVKDFNNYDVIRYKNCWLGSRGRRIGEFFTGKDDFNVIVPKFDTEIELHGRTGSYNDIVINQKAFDKKPLIPRFIYEEVLPELEHFVNKDSSISKKIFIVSDSFSRAVSPYFILSYSQVKSNWHNFDYKQIMEYKPDIIIMLEYADRAVNCVSKFILP